MMAGIRLNSPELYVQNREFDGALDWIADALPFILSINILFNLCKTEEKTPPHNRPSRLILALLPIFVISKTSQSAA